MTGEKDLDTIVRLLPSLEPDALRVVLGVVHRLRKGYRAYGRLDLATDTRDWRAEELDELLDAVVYRRIAELSAQPR